MFAGLYSPCATKFMFTDSTESKLLPVRHDLLVDRVRVQIRKVSTLILARYIAGSDYYMEI